MSDIWQVVLTRLVAKSASRKAELQRLVNLGDNVDEVADKIEKVLSESVMTEVLISRWQELRAQSEAAVNAPPAHNTEEVEELENG